jgi:hypothetical protein
MDGIIDKDSNPFRKDSWIEQGYSFTPDRQELTPILFKRSIEEIKFLKWIKRIIRPPAIGFS